MNEKHDLVKKPSTKTKKALDDAKLIKDSMQALDKQLEGTSEMEEMKKVAVIGDITVKADSGFVSISVDDEVVVFMDREAQFGLQQLVDTLQSLII